MFDIVFMALARWDGPYSSTAYSIAKELSRENRVFYIENPLTWKDFIASFKKPIIKTRWKALLFGRSIYTTPEKTQLYIVTPRLVLPINWMSDGKLYRFFLKLNNAIFNRAIKKAFKKYNISDNYIALNSFNPFYWPTSKGYPKPFLHIYQSVDNISKSEYIGKHGPKLEEEYVANADLSITTSTQLKTELSKFGKDVYLVPNAADIALFKTAHLDNLVKPEVFAGINKPVILYTGNICQRLNYDLLNAIADKHQDKILLMVGPTSIDNEGLKKLKAKKNVMFTGPKKLEELPAFLKYADCAIIPFLCNDLTKSIYPLKINEYLASGVPVVTTNFSADINNFKEVIYLSQGDEFVDNIDLAIAESSEEGKQNRVKAASNNTWEDRAKQVIDIVNKYTA